MVAYEAALALQAAQPRCDWTVNQLPALGVLTPGVEVPVYYNGQTYMASAALFASVAPFPTGIYNVQTYGMLPSNSGSVNQLAFQECINACLENGGGIVFIPNGRYPLIGGVTVGTGTGGIRFLGESPLGAVLLQQSSANTFTMTFTFGQCGFNNMSVEYASGQTGTAFYTNSSAIVSAGEPHPGNNQYYDSIQVTGATVGYYFFDTQNVYMNNCTHIGPGAGGICGWWIDGGSYGSAGATKVFLTNCSSSNDMANGTGVILGCCESVTLLDCTIGSSNIGMDIGSALVVNNPDRVSTISKPVKWPLSTQLCLCIGTEFSQCASHGLYIHPPGPMVPTTTPGSWTVVELNLNICRFEGNAGNGLYFGEDLATLSSGTIVATTISACSCTYCGSGMVIETGQDFMITGGFYSGNHVNGILITAETYLPNHINIVGITARGRFGASVVVLQNYGIQVENAPQAVYISDCNLDGNDTVNLYPGNNISAWGAGCKVVNNQGFNPQGFQTANPSFPASGVFAENQYIYPVQVFTTGGCITAVALQTTAFISTGSTNVQLETVYSGAGLPFFPITLQPTDQMRIVYTGSPHWQWQGQ